MPPRPAPRPLVLTALFAAALVAGCTQFPDLDARQGPDIASAAYPALVPVEGLLDRADPARITPRTEDALNARVTALRARADRLRGTVIDSGTRVRMRGGVSG